MFWLVLATLILPPEVRAVALFLMLARAPLAGGNGLLRSGGTGLFNARPGLVAPYAMSGIGIFFTRQSFLGPPDELEEARRVEGAWEWKLRTRISVPQGLVFTGLGCTARWPGRTTRSHPEARAGPTHEHDQEEESRCARPVPTLPVPRPAVRQGWWPDGQP